MLCYVAPLRCGEDASLEVLQRTIPSALHIKDTAIRLRLSDENIIVKLHLVRG